MNKRILSIDLETYSSVDITKAGVYKYAEAPDFEILLFAYAFDDEPITVLDLTKGDTIPQEVESPSSGLRKISDALKLIVSGTHT